MSTFYLLMANCIAFIHLVVALYLLSLPFVMLAQKARGWYLKVQAGIVAIAGVFHFTTGVCPLTFGENYMRVSGGGNRYEGNFLNHYAEKLFHFSLPDKLISNGIIVLAMLLVVAIVLRISGRQKPAESLSRQHSAQ